MLKWKRALDKILTWRLFNGDALIAKVKPVSELCPHCWAEVEQQEERTTMYSKRLTTECWRCGAFKTDGGTWAGPNIQNMEKYRPMLGGYIYTGRATVPDPKAAPSPGLVRHIDPVQVRRLLWPLAVRAAADMAADALKYDDDDTQAQSSK